ncbi:MAG TPA: octanoyltransferase, partial [Cutibacterium acnes]|nr:octanoyltransferase [Cutibacterium acnes]
MQQDPPTSQPHTPQIVDGVKPRGWVDHPAGLHFEYLGIADSRPTRTEY